jgi:AraC-like DNA-binding protein
MKHCGGHDSIRLAARVGRLGCPLVNVCHAGIGEVAVPVFVSGRQVATFFCGQVRTERVARAGFAGVMKRTRRLDLDVDALRDAFEALPEVSEERMQHVGEVLSVLAHHHAERLDRQFRARREELAGHPRVERALAYARKHCCEEVREADVAEECGISASHLSRLFRRIMGVTFTSYLNELRMAEAQKLLVMSSLSVMEVAHCVGFSRHSYFSQRFRRAIGVTPFEFRRRVLRERAANGQARRPDRGASMA